MRTIDTPFLRNRAPHVPLGQILRDLLQAIDRPLAVWQQRQEHREQLRHMPEYLLRDIGITEAEAQHEASKPFWQA